MDFNYVVTRQYLLIVVSLGELRQVFLAMKVFQVKHVSSLFKYSYILHSARQNVVQNEWES